MPVNEKKNSEPLYQRDQYAKGGVGRRYWDYRDKVALSYLDSGDRMIVDLGCGEGITLEKAAARFPNSLVTGVDCLEENVEICGKHRLSALQGDVYSLDIESSTVNAALLLEVIEHLERPEQALAEIHRILVPGGKVIVMFPNDRAFRIARILTFKFKEAFYEAGHVRQWTPREATEALRGQGFDVYSARSIPFFAWSVSLHCVVAARKRNLQHA